MDRPFRYIGKRLIRKDAYDKVTGKGIFTSDVQLPGMLHAKVLRSKYAHANIRSIDVSRALQMPGVMAALTYQDIPRVPALHHDGKATDYYLLDRRVRWVGDEVAVIAAETEETAEEALDLIDVEYEVLPSVYTIQDALKPDAPTLHPELDYGDNNASNVVPTGARTHMEIGDVETGFEDADVIVEEDIRVADQCHCYPEQHIAVAHWDGPDRFSIWMSMQCPHRMRDELANMLGLSRDKIRVIASFIGGGFGGKARFLRHLGITVLLAKKAQRPVRLALRLEETMPQAVRDCADVSWKVGVKHSGELTAIKRDCTMNSGAYVISSGLIGGLSLSEPVPLFKMKNYGSTVKNVYTNINPSGSYRGFGSTESITPLSIVMFRTAEALGMDPLEFLIKSVDPSPAKVNCLQEGANRFGWKDKWKGWGKPTLIKGAKRRGIGLGITAMGRAKGGGEGAGSAIVKLNEDGSATVFIGSVELGQGILTAVAKIVAEELGVSYDNITVINGDTDTTPFDSGQSGSHTTFDVGLPALQAARDAKSQLLELAAPKLGMNPEDLETGEGWIYARQDHEKRLSFREAMFSGYHRKIHIMDVNPVIAFASTSSGKKSPLDSASVDFVELEVDTETGDTRTLNYVVVVDCGRAINPDGVEGQFEHAFSAGLGWSLMEKPVLDSSTGKFLNANYLDYKVPTSLDMPENSSIVLVEPVDPVGPFGAKGAGEEAIAASAAAFVNAVHCAINVKFNEFPITPDKILLALKGGKVT